MRPRQRIQPRRIAMVLAVFLALSGCKEVLYSGLTETEANQMMSLLEASGIGVSRQRDKDGVYQVLVDKNQIGVANSILVSNGLPQRKFASMDQVFDAQGLVGSPFEERVRYIFALEEKLTESLVSIHGIRDARVTVSLPEKTRLGKAQAPASASIILHYEPDFSVNEAVPKIKTLIANSVQDLEYDGVSIVSFPAQSASAISPQSRESLMVSAAQAAETPQTEPQVVNRAANETLVSIVIGLVFVLLLAATLRLALHGKRTRGS